MTDGSSVRRGMGAYREILAIPVVAWSILPVFAALVSTAGMSLTLTLHVVTALHRGYVAAGLVGAATTIGAMVGAPMVGRALDRHGLRRVVAVCGAVSCGYWLAISWLPYQVLVVLAFPAGALMIPTRSIFRQVLVAAVPQERLRSAFSLETSTIELSFIGGPTILIFLAVHYSTRVALTAIGTLIAVAAVLLWLRNPLLRGTGDPAPSAAAAISRMRDLIDRRLTATLLVTVSALFVLGGIEISALSALRAHGAVGWAGVMAAILATASIFGGVVYGAARRSVHQLTLAPVFAALAIPAGLILHPWWLLALALVPNQLLCTPTLAATAESLIRQVPAQARGAATGLHESSTRLGLAISSPVVGAVIDNSSPGWGFAAAGLGGLLLASAAAVLAGGLAPAVPAQPSAANLTSV
jgi:predicted MFS family arabinose efflux permease